MLRAKGKSFTEQTRCSHLFCLLCVLLFSGLGRAYVLLPVCIPSGQKSFSFCPFARGGNKLGGIEFQRHVATTTQLESEEDKGNVPRKLLLASDSPKSLEKPSKYAHSRQQRYSNTNRYFSNSNSNKRRRTPRMTKSPDQVEQELTRALVALKLAVASCKENASSDSSAADAVHLLLFPTVRECNAALAAFGDAPDLLRTLRIFGKMRKAVRLQRDLQEAAATARNSNKEDTSRGRSADKSSYWPVPAPTLVTYSTLMSRFVKANKPIVALRLWNLMIKDTDIVEIDVRAANILMNCYAKTANVEAAQKLLDEMKQQQKSTSLSESTNIRLPPPNNNNISYNTLMSACHKADDLDTAVATITDMVEVQGIPADVQTYTSLIATVARRSCKTSGRYDPTPAFQFLDDMRNQGIQPNGMTYSALIAACGRCNRSDLALQGLRMMLRQKAEEQKALEQTKSGDYKTDKYTLSNEVGAWTAAIDACGRSGRLKTAIQLFYGMTNFGVQPNTVTCGALTDSLLRAGKTSETLDVLRYMKVNGIPPSEVMYTSLMARAEKLVEMERRNQQQRDAFVKHLHPRSDNIVPENDLKVIGPDGSGEDTKAIEVYTELIQSLIDGTEDSTRYGAMYRKQKGRKEPQDSKSLLLLKVFLVFQEMKMAGAEVDLPCYNTLLRACAKAGDVARAQDVLRKMQDDNIEPNDTSWRLLLRSASTAPSTNNGPRVNRSDTVQISESIWRLGISYRGGRRRLIDEPARQQWKPSVNSLMSLIAVYMREANATSRRGDETESKALYRQVVQLYEDILFGENEEMGMDRIDLDHLLENENAMLIILQAIVALEKLESSTKEKDNLRSMATSILKLDCFNESSRHSAENSAFLTARSWAK